MTKSSIKIRSTIKGDEAKVKCLIKHPMESGLRKNKKTKKLIPAKFIQEVVCKHNDKTVMTAQWNGTVSTNPYMVFYLTGVKAGDMIKISWVDNTGQNDSTEEVMPTPKKKKK
ncbi:MAG: thiosulfate oxidation carrier complex protein SoxZ [Gammaproteobacteria bacterium]|nr:MAG: thiosulfate oxidation carrier complex protein SoxZ [Gammaproteobacteria bacterium]